MKVFLVLPCLLQATILDGSFTGMCICFSSLHTNINPVLVRKDISNVFQYIFQSPKFCLHTTHTMHVLRNKIA